MILMPKKKKKSVKRKARKAGKKRDVSEIKSHHSVLSEALRDIAKELSQMRSEKHELEASLDGVVMSLTSTQNQEVRMKDQLRRLSSAENELNLKRARLRKKLEATKSKIQKVRQLSSQMESLS